MVLKAVSRLQTVQDLHGARPVSADNLQGAFSVQGAYPAQGAFPFQGAFSVRGAFHVQGAYPLDGAYPVHRSLCANISKIKTLEIS